MNRGLPGLEDMSLISLKIVGPDIIQSHIKLLLTRGHPLFNHRECPSCIVTDGNGGKVLVMQKIFGNYA